MENFIKQVADKLSTSAEATIRLSFLKSILPPELLERVTRFSTYSKELEVLQFHFVPENAKVLMDLLLTNCPPSITDNFSSGNPSYGLGPKPLTRDEAFSLRHTHAPVPVSAFFKENSTVLGARFCWIAPQTTEGLTAIRIEVHGLNSELEASLLGEFDYALTCGGYAEFAMALTKPITSLNGIDLDNKEQVDAQLDPCLRYLQEILDSEHSIRRGIAPVEVLQWLAQSKFGIPVKVRPGNRPSTSGKAYFTVSLEKWHRIDEINMPFNRNNSLNDKSWHDLIKP